MSPPNPTVSVVVPVHNEQSLLDDQVCRMLEALNLLAIRYELLLVENGSADKTLDLCRDLERRFGQVRVLNLSLGDYGLALKYGILNARNDVLVIFNLEFWSAEFVHIALAALESRVLVIGSKSAPGAYDERAFVRRAVTRAYNSMLRLLWGFDGTDTHGMKAFWRQRLLPIVHQCKTGSWVFDTELVLRAQRAGISKLELPTDVCELRPPSRRALLRRGPLVLKELWVLSRALPFRFGTEYSKYSSILQRAPDQSKWVS